jgi:hypothetical protein
MTLHLPTKKCRDKLNQVMQVSNKKKFSKNVKFTKICEILKEDGGGSNQIPSHSTKIKTMILISWLQK